MANKAFTVKHGLNPSTDNSVDLGTSSLEFKDLYIDGTAFLDAIGFGSVAMTLPTDHGNNGQVLKSNGSNALAWADDTAGTITALNNQSGNRLVTINSHSTTALDGEENLTFNGSILTVAGTANTKQLNISASGAALASQNAYKIILVDLTDPGTMWDVEAFLARVRHTSWYDELGAPPMRGAIWIDNAQEELIWWNLDTDAKYMSFEKGTGGIAQSASPVITDIAFLDGILYATMTTGMQLVQVDFLRDRATRTSATNNTVFVPFGIANRNGGWGHINYRNAAQYVIVNSAVNAVSAVRDPLLYDEFDRPKHWWAVNTSASGYGGPVSVYNPVDDAIYDGGNLNSSITANTKPVALSPNGGLVLVVELGSQEYVNWFSSVYALYADWATGWNEMYLKSGNTFNTHPFSSSVDWAALDICDAPPLGGQSNIVAVGGDEGLVLAFAHTGNDSDKTAIIAVTSSYNTPYMKGARAGAYPLNDVNDRGGAGNTLTNNNSTTFTSGVFGNAATFNGTNQSLTRSGDSDFDMGSGDFAVSLYFKSTSATNPTGTSDSIMMLGGSSNQDILSFQLGANTGVITVGATSNNWSSHDSIATTADFHDARWHHAVYQKYDGNWELWVDGLLCATTAVYNAGTLNFENLAVGTGVAQWNNTYMAGQVAQLSICKTGWTPNEINLEYQRMVRGLGGATATLANTDVKSIRIDQNSGLAAITTAANHTEIWDVKTAMRESIDAASTGAISDADVALKSGADDPEYITGRVAAIEFDGQARRVIG